MKLPVIGLRRIGIRRKRRRAAATPPVFAPPLRRDGATVLRLRAEHRRRIARRVLRGALGFAGIAATGFVVRDYAGWVEGGEVFRVEEIDVRGSARIPPAEIPALAAITPGTSIFAFDAAELSEAISRHPWVRRAEVAKQLPHRVEVEIEEREPIAIVLVDRELVQIDAEGVLLPTRDARVLEDLPMITGAEVTRPIPFGVNDPAAPWSRAAVFLAGIDALRDAAGEPVLRVSELHVDMKASEFSVLEEGGRRLRFSAGEPGVRLSDLFPVLEELAASDLVADYVDLRFRDQIVVGGARPRPVETDSTESPEGETAG